MKLIFRIIAGFLAAIIATLIILYMYLASKFYNPIWKVKEERVNVDGMVLDNLLAFRNERKFTNSIHDGIPGERERLSAMFNALLDTVIEGIEENPSKKWFFNQCQPSLIEVAVDETEAREQYLFHVEKLMMILNIESSDGFLNYYAYRYLASG